MEGLIFGVFVPATAITKKIVKEAEYKTKNRFCPETGRKLRDEKIQVKPQVLEWTFLGETYDKKCLSERGVIFNFCFTKHNRKGLQYTDYMLGLEKGFLVGFELDNYSSYSMDDIIQMKSRLRTEFGLEDDCILNVSVDRQCY